MTAGAGFLAAVLWFDLMHDVQVVGHGRTDLPDAVLTSIGAYYRRVTTDARPMNRLVAAMMLATVGCAAAQAAVGDTPTWVGVTSLALAVSAAGLAAGRTVRNAVRLGRRAGTADVESRLARAIFRDHVFCISAITTVLLVELAFGR